MNNKFTLSEKSLIENCINGNRKSQKELFERFSPKMFAICLDYANNQIDAEDILQNAFVKLFNTLHKFKGDEPFEEWVRKIFINTASKLTKRNKVRISIDQAFKNIITEEHIMALDDLYENIYTKTSDKFRKDDSVFKLYAVDGFHAKETTATLNPIASNAETLLPADTKSPVRVVQNTAVKSQNTKSKYTIQKGDDRRLNKDGVLRVYNLREPVDIPVRMLLGKWKKEHIGVTLVFIKEKWQIDGEMIGHSINIKEVHSPIRLKRLLKFV